MIDAVRNVGEAAEPIGKTSAGTHAIESHVKTFRLDGPVVFEGIFEAATDNPAGA